MKNKINQLENIIKEKDIEINNISNNNKNKNEKNDEEINNIKETNKKLNEEINKKNKELEYIKELIEKQKKEYENKLESNTNEFNNKIIKLENKIKKYKEEKEKKKQKEEYEENEKEEELKKRENDVIEKENEINKKLIFLEDKENYIEKELQKIEEYKKELQNKNKIIETIKKEKIDLINEINSLKIGNNKNENNNNKNLTKKIQELNNIIKQLEYQNKQLNSKIKKQTNLSISLNNNIFEDTNNDNHKRRNNSVDSSRPISPISTYLNPTLIGLNNIGATCFINATLQCLSQTRDLSNYFLKESNENKIMNNNIAQKDPTALQLTPSFLKLIKNLWSKTRTKPYSPNELVHTIEQINPLFKQGEPGDSKDFIISILEQIHNELKGPIKKMQNNLNTIEPLNQYDKNNAFIHFFKDFQKECSIISDVFFGFIETTNICQNCQYNYNAKGLNNPICYNYQIFNCLIFPLEEVKNMKNSMNSTMMNNFTNNVVTIIDCFIYNQKSELFQGENQNYCNLCKQLCNSIYTTQIFSGPNNLVLILNRGKGNIYNVKLIFSEIIDITQFILQKDTQQIFYNLYGVITHIGQSDPNAHFVASCKSPVDNYWYRYNDSIVSRITNIQKEIIDFGTPYILFYQKNK